MMLQSLMAAVQAFKSPHKTADGHEFHQKPDDSCDQAESEGEGEVLSHETDSSDESEGNDPVGDTVAGNQEKLLGIGSKTRRLSIETKTNERGKSHIEFWKTGNYFKLISLFTVRLCSVFCAKNCQRS